MPVWQIYIKNDFPSFKYKKSIVKKILDSAYKQAKKYRRSATKAHILSIWFTNNAAIKKLNFKYRKKNKVTDVLTFSQSKLTNSKILGDLVISIPKAKAQSKDFGNNFEQEILRLIIHGILHLYGFDHEKVSGKESKLMQYLETKIFKKFYCEFNPS